MVPVPRWFVAACWVMAINFSVWVGLQCNDPDPLRWMAIYGAAAATTAVLPAKRVAAGVAFAVGLVALAWGIYLARQVWSVLHFSDLWKKMAEKGGAVEIGREAGGLVIVAVWMLGASAFRALKP